MTRCLTCKNAPLAKRYMHQSALLCTYPRRRPRSLRYSLSVCPYAEGTTPVCAAAAGPAWPYARCMSVCDTQSWRTCSGHVLLTLRHPLLHSHSYVLRPTRAPHTRSLLCRSCCRCAGHETGHETTQTNMYDPDRYAIPSMPSCIPASCEA